MRESVVVTNDNIYKLVQDAIKKNGTNCDLNYIDVSQVTDMSYLFFGSEFIGDISRWDVSNVTNMSQMFEMSQFNGDISQWDVSNVIDMSRMFANSQFNGGIGRWNVSHVTNMYRMFADSQFDGDISDWNVSNVEDMSLMFEMSQFNGDISHWKTPYLKNMSRMFCGSKFTGDISGWNVSNVTDMSSLFCGSDFNGNISRWNVSNVTDMSGLFWESKFTGDISEWNVSNVTTMRGMFFHSHFNGNIGGWNVSKVCDMGEMFYASRFNGDISQWNVSNVTDMSSMFRESWFNGDVSHWNVSQVTNMSCMFLKSRFNGNISNWDVSNVEDMSWMFGRSVFDGDLANWDVSNVKNMNHMFSGGLGSKKINPFNGDISGWNVSNVMDMRYMYNNSEFNGNIDSWNVNKKTKKEGMFWGCPLDKRMPIWYNFRGAGWFEKNYKEGDVLDSIVDKAAESISKAESVKRTDIKLDRIEPYIKASIENYCKKYDIDTDDNQIRFAAENLKKYLAVKYGLLQKFEDRTILEPILKQAIESIRKSENAQAAATAQKNDITIAMLVPYIKDSIEKYCQENNIKADNNQIQWVAVKLARYYENISWLIGKLRVKTVLEPIINHAIELIRKSEKNIITPYKILPHVKDSVQLYCQENNIDADDSQIQWISFALTRYFDYVCWLGKNFKEKVDLEPIINQAIESIRMSENAKVNVVGQKKNITIDMVEPYVKESIEKYYQENKIDANDNQLQWAANMLTKIFRNECIRKGKEKATRAKMKEMLTSDAEEDLS